jgi:hypothetical protein
VYFIDIPASVRLAALCGHVLKIGFQGVWSCPELRKARVSFFFKTEAISNGLPFIKACPATSFGG